MTNEEKQIAIAEACGWKQNGHIDHGGNTRPLLQDPDKPYLSLVDASLLPDYFNDLNACAQARKILTQTQQESYAHTLFGLIVRPVEIEYGPLNLKQADILWMMLNATAEQHAEAFGLTLGLWGD
jgi:hypothetical protein